MMGAWSLINGPLRRLKSYRIESRCWIHKEASSSHSEFTPYDIRNRMHVDRWALIDASVIDRGNVRSTRYCTAPFALSAPLPTARLPIARPVRIHIRQDWTIRNGWPPANGRGTAYSMSLALHIMFNQNVVVDPTVALWGSAHVRKEKGFARVEGPSCSITHWLLECCEHLELVLFFNPLTTPLHAKTLVALRPGLFKVGAAWDPKTHLSCFT